MVISSYIIKSVKILWSIFLRRQSFKVTMVDYLVYSGVCCNIVLNLTEYIVCVLITVL